MIMAFFDKLKDKTSDMLEVSKINSKISDEKAKITVQKGKLAELYWEKFEKGEEIEEQAMEFCLAIKASTNAIQAFNQEIIKIKEEPSQASELRVEDTVITREVKSCGACGSEMNEGIKFCPQCGMPVEAN